MKAFNAPIPGQSLTTPPKNFAWERPPEIVDPEEAIQMHLTRLSNPDMVESILDLVELEDMDVNTITQGILRGAVANGIHSIDVALIAAPIVHEYIKNTAKAAGLNPEDGFEDKQAKKLQRESREILRARKQIREMPKVPKKVEKKVVEAPVEQAPVRRGLMARGGK